MKKIVSKLSAIVLISISLNMSAQNYIPMLLKNGRYSFVQPKSKSIIIEKEFDEAKPFSDGVAFVKIRSKWGAINTQGELVLKPKYSYLTQYPNGFIGGVLEETDYIVYGNIIPDTLFNYSKKLAPDWDFITYFSKQINLSDFAIVKKHNTGNMLIVNRDIEIVSEINDDLKNIIINENLDCNKYNDSDDFNQTNLNQNDLNISNFSNGFFRMRRRPDGSGKSFTDYFNLKGELLIKDNYYDYESDNEYNNDEDNDKFNFRDGIAMILKDQKYGFIDTSVNEVVPLKYSSVNLFSNGQAKVSSEDFTSYINKKGIPLFPFEKKYQTLSDFNEGIALLTTVNNLIIAINPNGEKIFTFPYPYSLQSPGKFSNGKLAVNDIQNNEMCNIIDTSGKIISKINASIISNFSKDGFALTQTEKYSGKRSLIDSKILKDIFATKYDKIFFITKDFKNEMINTLEPKEIDFQIDLTKFNLFIENLIFVENASMKYYVDNTGFEYKE